TSPRSLSDLLIGRVAGVDVRQTEHGIAVRIRGAVALHGNTAPLYVIDGMPINPGPAGALAGLSPREIESIEVLKDAIDTTMYGARGANGVILITTKRPGR
ncbi:MAG: TonB-dependent receptor plug domain-containing protein, partial [Gemmatimonadetes bacterium]|nr:TonB-dependent receptor plug domain-containing protein [Gemmatimonadota bacterium]